MTCPHRFDGDGLPCTRETPHDPDKWGGHTYTSASGSDVGCEEPSDD